MNEPDPHDWKPAAPTSEPDDYEEHRLGVCSDLCLYCHGYATPPGPSISDEAEAAVAVHLFQIDRDRKGRGLVDWKYASDYEREFFTSEARAILKVAAPFLDRATKEEQP